MMSGCLGSENIRHVAYDISHVIPNVALPQYHDVMLLNTCVDMMSLADTVTLSRR
jgi:hypothetical protein